MLHPCLIPCGCDGPVVGADLRPVLRLILHLHDKMHEIRFYLQAEQTLSQSRAGYSIEGSFKIEAEAETSKTSFGFRT